MTTEPNLERAAAALALVPRLVEQAREYGFLMLTVDEMIELLAIVTASPGAAIALGPGKVIPIASLVVYVLPDLDDPFFPDERNTP